MKMFVTLVLVMLMSSVNADTGTTFGDLLYLPNQGEKLFINSSRWVDQDYSGTKFNGSNSKTHTFEKEKKTIAMDQKLSYSFMDQLLIGAGVEVAFVDTLFTRSYKDNNNYEVGYPDIKNNGWSDPYIFGTYRILSKANSDSVLDFNFKLVPSFLNAKRGQNGVNEPTVGDHASGGHQVQGGLSFGKQFSALEALAYANLNYSFDSKVKYVGVDPSAGNGAGDIKYTEDSKLAYNFGINSLFHCHDRFLTGVGLDAQFNPESSLVGKRSNNTELKEVTNEFWTYTGSLNARFIWLRDLYLEGTFAYSMVKDHDFTTYTNNNQTTKESNSDFTSKLYGFRIFAKF